MTKTYNRGDKVIIQVGIFSGRPGEVLGSVECPPRPGKKQPRDGLAVLVREFGGKAVVQMRYDEVEPV